jgi:ferredoxin-NADP reductase
MAAQEKPFAGYSSRLLSRTQVAEGTMAFHFAKPSGFDFKAGQFAIWTLLEPPETDAEGNKRTFTIASAPFEDQLMIATRMRDTAFKRSLKSVTLGTEIRIAGPMGSFTLHRDSARPAVLLAGGIGITPFFSIVKQASNDGLPHKLYLFYSNHGPEDAPFLDILQELQKTNTNFHLIATMTEMTHSQRKWAGETGFINKEMLARHVSDLQEPIYYIAGPPAMVAAMQEMLVTSGIDEDNLRMEGFAGY